MADGADTAPRLRVLAVDDDHTLRELLQLMLEAAGHDVTTAGSAIVAQQLVDAEGFDVVVTDMRMHGARDGFDVARRALARNPRLGVVFLSGTAVDASEFESIGMPVRALTKPIERGDLSGAVLDVHRSAMRQFDLRPRE